MSIDTLKHKDQEIKKFNQCLIVAGQTVVILGEGQQMIRVKSNMNIVMFDIFWRIIEMMQSYQTEVGHSLSLECDYQLEGDSLYSLKWYRDDREFFRYIPQGDQQNKTEQTIQNRNKNIVKTSQELRMLSLSLFIQGSL